MDPGSLADWMQASAMAAAVAGLAAAGRWALRAEDAQPSSRQPARPRPADAVVAATAAEEQPQSMHEELVMRR